MKIKEIYERIDQLVERIERQHNKRGDRRWESYVQELEDIRLHFRLYLEGIKDRERRKRKRPRKRA
jgi:hypothetical protein